MATIISKNDAVQLMTDYYLWRYRALDFIEEIDNAIRYAAQNGGTETTISIPTNFTEESLDLSLAAINDAGYTDVTVSYTDQTITIKWSEFDLSGMDTPSV